MRKRGKQRWRTAFGVALLLALSLLAAQGQRRRDPLNPLEIDQLRDAMLDPDIRLKLYVKFSRDRMTVLEQCVAIRRRPSAADRPTTCWKIS